MFTFQHGRQIDLVVEQQVLLRMRAKTSSRRGTQGFANLQQSFLRNTKFKLVNFGTAYVEFFFYFLSINSYYNYWYYIFYIISRHFLKETSFV